MITHADAALMFLLGCMITAVACWLTAAKRKWLPLAALAAVCLFAAAKVSSYTPITSITGGGTEALYIVDDIGGTPVGRRIDPEDILEPSITLDHATKIVATDSGTRSSSSNFSHIPDSATWASENSLTYPDDINEFHIALAGPVYGEVEALTTGQAGFYVEGYTGYDAWMGAQNGVNTKWTWGNVAASDTFAICKDYFGVHTNNARFQITSTDKYLFNVQGNGLANFHVRESVVSGVHQSIAAHRDWLLENNNDTFLQVATDNAGSVANGLILTAQQASNDGRHWVIQHRGTSLSNEFQIGYDTTTATGENIATNQTPFFKMATDGDTTLANGSGKFDNDSTAGNTRFLVYDIDNATLERVTVGAADSGGAGYKVLRIPN